MADGFQDSDGWENPNDGRQVGAFWENGFAEDNPWTTGLFGFDSADRVVEPRGVSTNYYRGVSELVANDEAAANVLGMVGSSSNGGKSLNLQLVPFVDQDDRAGGFRETEENASVAAGSAKNGTVTETEHADAGNENKRELLLPMASWDEKLKGMEEMFGYVKGLRDYAGKLEDAIYKIAVVACSNAMVKRSVGYLIPDDMFRVARGNGTAYNYDVPDGVIIQEDLALQFDSIGITCHEKYNCTFGGAAVVGASVTACLNESCSQNRYKNPSVENVWNLSKWIEREATDADLSMCWVDPGVHGVMALTGLQLKRYIQGQDVGVDMFTACTRLLRWMETCSYSMQKCFRTIHYVDHQWASMVTTGLLTGDASTEAFYTGGSTYQLSPYTMVMAPVCVQQKWTCYVMDLQNRVLSVLDPNLTIRSSLDLGLHQINASMILGECVRCMRQVCSNNMVGRGQWRGNVLFPRHMAECDRIRDEGNVCSLIPCIIGFNGDYVCGSYDEDRRCWGRRKLVYNLMQMAGYLGSACGSQCNGEATAESDRVSSTGH